MTERKGIILAGGTGSRLWPLTQNISKQLLPIYDKPMIYYPITTLMLTGVREIALITTPRDRNAFESLLGDGSQWGLRLTYIEQSSPDGLAQAYTLAEDFLDGAPSVMILGDNLFFGGGLAQLLCEAAEDHNNATIFGYHVSDPARYGVIDYSSDGKVRAIVEKPSRPPSNYAVTGIYFLDGDAPSISKKLNPSARGELEIADMLDLYRANDRLNVKRLGRGFAWLDTGTHSSLLEAGNFVRTLVERQGLQVGSPDETAYRQGWISSEQLRARAKLFQASSYGAYLSKLD